MWVIVKKWVFIKESWMYSDPLRASGINRLKVSDHLPTLCIQAQKWFLVWQGLLQSVWWGVYPACFSPDIHVSWSLGPGIHVSPSSLPVCQWCNWGSGPSWRGGSQNNNCCCSHTVTSAAVEATSSHQHPCRAAVLATLCHCFLYLKRTHWDTSGCSNSCPNT